MSERIEQGVAIRAARIAKRMTQAHLAVAAEVSEKTARRAESGDRIGPESLRALCAVLDLDATSLSTEAECIPDAAADAELRLAQRQRQAAFLVSVLTASLVATSAWTVFDAVQWAVVAVAALTWLAFCAFGDFARVAVLADSRAELVSVVREEAREKVETIRSPYAALRARLAGWRELASAAQVACLPPLVLGTLMALKGLMLTGSMGSSSATLVFGLFTWGAAKACVREVSGIDPDADAEAVAGDVPEAEPQRA